MGKDSKYILSLIFIVFLTRIFLLEGENTYQSIDPINYIFGSISFDLKGGSPHLPGSILYCKLIYLVNYLINDYHKSLITINLFWTLASIPFSYFILKHYKVNYHFISVLFIYSIPGIWFYTSITEYYAFDLFFSVIILYLVTNNKYLFLTPIILAIGMGYRQSSGVLLAPIIFYNIVIYIRTKGITRNLILSSILSMIVLSSWLYSLIESTGGLSEYIDLYTNKNPIPESTTLKNLVKMSSFGLFFFITTLFLFRAKFLGKFRIELILSILPGLIFFALMHYNKGYFMLITVPIIVQSLILFKPKLTRLYVAILLNLIIYFLSPSIFPVYYNKMKSDKRPVSKLQLQSERMMFGFSSNYGTIVKGDQLFDELEKLEIPNNSKIAFDQSLPIQVKLFSYNKGLDSTYYFNSSSNLKLYQLISLDYKMVDISILNSDFIFIGHSEFFKNYLFDIASSLNQSQNFTVYKINEDYLYKYQSILEDNF
ncbi:hypothetical protein OAQ99_00200 [Candidatus Kapabacteria bacterium]|nr:hypothetical protein [Candidatus Kapabacteria bacterium]